MFTVGSLVARANQVAAQMAAPLFEGNMTSTVVIVRGGDADPKWDEDTSSVVRGEAPEEIYGPSSVPLGKEPIALIRTVSGPVTMALADEPQYFQSTFISVPLWARTPQVDDVVQILTSPDPALVERYYRIVDVEQAGQLPLYQRMQVVGIQPGRYWRG